ncbi:MAG: hypothetical protein JNL41_03210 [Phenylobacterium sp.]|uniref:hypothetical protein n=1 Tax=Phenylobacterium sp. TaxID=1871053 RepID=UPI001A3FFBD4|nr:hypothetical protein [Phenylobacterium sp.]MBL8553262.1 hypothetical protein [Phenylobacterium sp.]
MTTTTTDRRALALTVANLTNDLIQAQDDLALHERLTGARAKVRQLQSDLAQAKTRLDAAQEQERQSARDAAFAVFSDIHVRKEGDDHLLRLAFPVTVTRKQFDGYQTADTTQTFPGIQSLPSDALMYLVEKHPDRIPAEIMALAPGDPYEAINEYLISLRRGYLRGPVAA